MPVFSCGLGKRNHLKSVLLGNMFFIKIEMNSYDYLVDKSYLKKDYWSKQSWRSNRAMIDLRTIKLLKNRQCSNFPGYLLNKIEFRSCL